MSRSGYSDDCGGWELIMWRGAVNSAIRGKRGQAFLRETLAALDAMPERRLIQSALVCEDGMCTMGVTANARGIDVSEVDADDPSEVAGALGIAKALAAEIAYMNDDEHGYTRETPEQRWTRMRAWVAAQIKGAA